MSRSTALRYAVSTLRERAQRSGLLWIDADVWRVDPAYDQALWRAMRGGVERARLGVQSDAEGIWAFVVHKDSGYIDFLGEHGAPPTLLDLYRDWLAFVGEDA